jgi:hypothetical protein
MQVISPLSGRLTRKTRTITRGQAAGTSFRAPPTIMRAAARRPALARSPTEPPHRARRPSAAARRAPPPARAGNLGTLERLAQADAPAAAAAAAAAPPDFSFATPHLDGPVAAVSVALIVLLLAISSDRILGFDLAAILSRAWLERHALARREEAIEGRARLEASFDDDADGGGGDGGDARGGDDPGGG